MDYQSVYQKLIIKAQSRQKPDCYTERHHIMPKSLGGSDDSDNLVALTAREHFIAHLLLAKIFGGPMIIAAFLMMNFNNKKYNARQYAWLKEEYRKLPGPATGVKHSEATKKKMRKKVVSDLTKIKISSARKGTKATDETKQKMSKNNKGAGNAFYGKTHSDESLLKMKIAAGRRDTDYRKKMSEIMKLKVQGENNPFYGKSHTAQTKQKIKEKQKNVHYFKVRINNEEQIVCGASDVGLLFDVSKQAILHIAKNFLLGEEYPYRNGFITIIN